jgi:hypothetical protein
MARMSVDDMVVRDQRITKLAKLIGWSRRETLGCLVMDVWPICYDQRESVIAAELVDLAAGIEGFALAMVASDLANWSRGNLRIRIRGAQERIEYLDHKKRAGSVGGIKSAESRNKKSSTSPDAAQARGNPPVPDPSPVPVHKIDASATPRPAPAQLELVKTKVDKLNSEHHQSIAAFTGYYQRTNSGAAPTWNDKTGRLISGLVRAHGFDEISRRLGILESSPPQFPPQPWDLATFVQHFDKCAAPSRPAPRGNDQIRVVKPL